MFVCLGNLGPRKIVKYEEKSLYQESETTESEIDEAVKKLSLIFLFFQLVPFLIIKKISLVKFCLDLFLKVNDFIRKYLVLEYSPNSPPLQ